MSDEDFYTVSAMRRFGGQFVRALGAAATHADEQNMFLLKQAFPHLFAKYKAMAEAEQEAGV